MTYSIKVQPYDDPYIKIAEEAMGTASELLIPGAFLVDIIPILKYVPKWFPGARFQSKAAVMRKHAAIMRNATFEATEEIMVCNIHHLFSDSYLFICIHFQASGNYDPSFITEALKDMQHSDTSNQDINLLKDVAVQAYLG